ncbi:hypothetical protein LINGRAHAP2_LOCUS30849, partial [Linum grandiflorum]
VEAARPRRLPQERSPASLGSVGSSTAAGPPGFGDDEASSPPMGLLLAETGILGASPGPLSSAALGPLMVPQDSPG